MHFKRSGSHPGPKQQINTQREDGREERDNRRRKEEDGEERASERTEERRERIGGGSP